MAGPDQGGAQAPHRLPTEPEGSYLHRFMLSPEQMTARVLEELEGARTVYVAPRLQARLPLPSTVTRIDALDDEVDLAIVDPERVRCDGSVEGAEIPPSAPRVVAVLTSTDRAALGSAPKDPVHPARTLRRVDRVITPLAVIDRTTEGLRVREVAPGVSAADVQRASEARLVAGPDLAVIGQGPGGSDPHR